MPTCIVHIVKDNISFVALVEASPTVAVDLRNEAAQANSWQTTQTIADHAQRKGDS